jgi:hypothetical protein
VQLTRVRFSTQEIEQKVNLVLHNFNEVSEKNGCFFNIHRNGSIYEVLVNGTIRGEYISKIYILSAAEIDILKMDQEEKRTGLTDVISYMRILLRDAHMPLVPNKAELEEIKSVAQKIIGADLSSLSAEQTHRLATSNLRSMLHRETVTNEQDRKLREICQSIYGFITGYMNPSELIEDEQAYPKFINACKEIIAFKFADSSTVTQEAKAVGQEQQEEVEVS